MSTPLTPVMLVKAMTSTSWDSPDIDPAKAELYFPYLETTLRDYQINNKRRISAWLAQFGHECGSFEWMREFGGDFARYAPYFGRGVPQLTWEFNYKEFAEETGFDAWWNPDIVAEDMNAAFAAAGWFWRGKSVPRLGGVPQGDLNPLADTATWESFDWLTRSINGGYNGKYDRDARYSHAWGVLPDDLTIGTGSKPKEEEKIVVEWPTGIVKPDANNWLRDDKGRYVLLEGAKNAKVDKGYLFTDSLIVPPAPEVKPAPAPAPAPEPEISLVPPGFVPQPVNSWGTWLQQHPTRYEWDKPVADLIRRLKKKFPDLHVNTYYDHPEGWGRDRQSFDLWAKAGRGYTIDPNYGQAAFDWLYNDPNKPDIEWCIWWGWMWVAGVGWKGAPGGASITDPGHYGHAHFTYYR